MKKNVMRVLSGAGIIALAAAGFVLGGLAHLAGSGGAASSGEGLSGQENRMLAQVATHPCPDGSYNVVSRDTLTVAQWGGGGDPRAWIPAATATFKDKGVDASALIERLYEVNSRPARIGFPSSPQEGYIVDDGSYAAYFQPGGGGAQKLQSDHPHAVNILRFSRPAYDEKTGLVLIYAESLLIPQDGGRGGFLLFRDENGTLKPMGVHHAWMSDMMGREKMP